MPSSVEKPLRTPGVNSQGLAITEGAVGLLHMSEHLLDYVATEKTDTIHLHKLIITSAARMMQIAAYMIDRLTISLEHGDTVEAFMRGRSKRL